jgi:hypothetical protein
MFPLIRWHFRDRMECVTKLNAPIPLAGAATVGDDATMLRPATITAADINFFTVVPSSLNLGPLR